MLIHFAVAFFGGCGALCRFGADKLINRGFWGIIVVNTCGSFVAGFVSAFGASIWGHGSLAPFVTMFSVGFLGGFTSFSTAMVDVVKIVDAKRRRGRISKWDGFLLPAALLVLPAVAAAALAAAGWTLGTALF